MKIIYTKSGSKGNCSVIQSETGGLLVIDAGIKFDKVNKEVGYQLHKAEACLITHAHADHTAYMSDFTEAGINTYLLPETRSQVPKCGSERYLRLLDESWLPDKHFIIFIKSYFTKSFIFKPCLAKHTNADGTYCPCVGYLIYEKGTQEKMLWMTDTQYIYNSFAPLDYYCIETNYLETNDWLKELPYVEKVVEQRRVQSHMSVETAIEFLKAQDLSLCKAIYLLHMSSNLTDKEKKEIVKRVKKVVGKGIKVYA